MAKRKQTQEVETTNSEEVKGDTTQDIQMEDKNDDLSLTQVYQEALKGKKFKRRGWSEQVGDIYVTIHRGETKLSLVKGDISTPYTPSHDDAVSTDWYEFSEEE